MNMRALLRGLRRSPCLSLAAVFCMALGMAATAADDEALPAFYERLEHELTAQPGVKAVALVWPTAPILEPIVGRLEHPAIETADPEGLRVSNYIIGDRFFDALAIPLQAGRSFDGREAGTGMPSAIISSSLAGRSRAALRMIDMFNLAPGHLQ